MAAASRRNQTVTYDDTAYMNAAGRVDVFGLSTSLPAHAADSMQTEHLRRRQGIIADLLVRSSTSAEELIVKTLHDALNVPDVQTSDSKCHGAQRRAEPVHAEYIKTVRELDAHTWGTSHDTRGPVESKL